MTDFRACGTIMGPAGLTAVFGMGTGVAPPVWSPEKRPAGGEAGWARLWRQVAHEDTEGLMGRGGGVTSTGFCVKDPWIAWSPVGGLAGLASFRLG